MSAESAETNSQAFQAFLKTRVDRLAHAIEARGIVSTTADQSAMAEQYGILGTANRKYVREEGEKGPDLIVLSTPDGLTPRGERFLARTLSFYEKNSNSKDNSTQVIDVKAGRPHAYEKFMKRMISRGDSF